MQKEAKEEEEDHQQTHQSPPAPDFASIPFSPHQKEHRAATEAEICIFNVKQPGRHYGWMRQLQGRLEAAAARMAVARGAADGLDTHADPVLSFPGILTVLEQLKTYDISPSELHWHEKGFYFVEQSLGNREDDDVTDRSSSCSSSSSSSSGRHSMMFPVTGVHILYMLPTHKQDMSPVLQIGGVRYVQGDGGGNKRIRSSSNSSCSSSTYYVEETPYAVGTIQAAIRAWKAKECLKKIMEQQHNNEVVQAIEEPANSEKSIDPAHIEGVEEQADRKKMEYEEVAV
mmetsp:Transcript_36841/g.59755  ORF Transcript_36841/g.59755 Transcript_36841/m.59755 type:complete len:286 (+) Transcript_36841:304-1161(+)